jgi:hypothetical protein
MHYPTLSWFDKTLTPSERLMHRLMLETFRGPRPKGQECRHLDDNKHNWRIENLKWGTRFENGQDRVRNGKQHSRKIAP